MNPRRNLQTRKNRRKRQLNWWFSAKNTINIEKMLDEEFWVTMQGVIRKIGRVVHAE